MLGAIVSLTIAGDLELDSINGVESLLAAAGLVVTETQVAYAQFWKNTGVEMRLEAFGRGHD